MFFMPETPYYLITKNKEQEAKKSLQWLRGIENVNNELDELKRAYSEQKKLGKVSYMSLITKKVYLKLWQVGRTAVERRRNVGGPSVDHQWTVGRMSAERRWTVGGTSAERRRSEAMLTL